MTRTINELTITELKKYFDDCIRTTGKNGRQIKVNTYKWTKQDFIKNITKAQLIKDCLAYINGIDNNSKLNPKKQYVVKYNGKFAYNYDWKEPENADKWVLHDDQDGYAKLPGQVVMAAIDAGFDVEVIEEYDVYKWVK